MTLDQVETGHPVLIQDIPAEDDLMLALRLGLIPGSECVVMAKVPGGAVVVRQGHTDIALGRALCRRIRVRV